MTSGSRKKKFSIKFELSPSGLLGVGLVCFCIFLWMFLLGVWAGQTVLNNGSYRITGLSKGGSGSRPENAHNKRVEEIPAAAAKAKPAEPTAALKPAVAEPGKKAPLPPALAGEDDSSYFAVQVGAFRQASYAEDALKEWRDKGYKPFSRPPEGADDKYIRIYVGRFQEVAEAREQAEALARKEKIKPFIATIPAGLGNNP